MAIGIAGALIGSAVIGGISNAVSGNKAAKASAAGAKESSKIQWDMYNKARDDWEPRRLGGDAAFYRQLELSGIDPSTAFQSKIDGFDSQLSDIDAQIAKLQNPDPQAIPRYGRGSYGAPQFVAPTVDNSKLEGLQRQRADIEKQRGYYDQFKNQPRQSLADSPDYKFAFDRGMTAVNQDMARRGLMNSSAADKARTRFGQGLATQQLNNARRALASLAGTGQAAIANTSNAGMNTAYRTGQNAVNAGNARASGYMATGDAVNNTINQSSGVYALNKMGYFG